MIFRKRSEVWLLRITLNLVWLRSINARTYHFMKFYLNVVVFRHINDWVYHNFTQNNKWITKSVEFLFSMLGIKK